MRSESTDIANRLAHLFNVRQKMLSGSLSLGVFSSLSASSVLAHPASPTPTFAPATTYNAPATRLPDGPAGSGLVAFPSSHTLHLLPTTTSSWTASSLAGGRLVNAPSGSKSALQGLVNAAPAANDLELNNSAAIFSAGSLAGFHSITIDVGGKEQMLNVNSSLTAAELVAAQQVLSGGKQEITINAKGIAVGGYFDLDSSSLSALDNAVGGSIGVLEISHGVQAIDTLSNLTFAGSLINFGTIDVGAATGTKGQTIDSISATNITNGAGAVIASASGIRGVVPASLSLDSEGAFINNGTVSSSGTLSVVAGSISNGLASTGAGSTADHSSALLTAGQNVNLSTTSLTNSGTISSTGGNVDILNGGGNNNIAVAGSGGTVEAVKGNINFNDADYAGRGNVTVTGGNWVSQQFNVNDGSGANNVSVGELTGQVNVTAGSSHVTAATSNLNLGTNNISGDPTYYNTDGSITITGTLDSGTNDLALVASTNIIGDSGSLATGGGALTLIAGANFTNPTTGSSLPPNGGSATPVTIANGSAAGKGSSTGGYIDLSGITLTGTTTNTAVSSVSTSGGNILMVAYKGSGSNSGSIVGTATAAQSSSAAGGANTINADGTTNGSVTLIAGGSQITAQNIQGSAVTITATTPTLSGGPTGSMTITNGTISSGTYVTSGKPSNTAITVTSITGDGTLGTTTIGEGTLTNTSAGVAISTAGKIGIGSINDTATGSVALSFGATSGSATLPINIEAGQLSLSGTTSGASIYVLSTEALTLNASSVLGAATMSVTADGGITIAGNLSAGTLTSVTEIIGGVSQPVELISGGTVHLTTTGSNQITTSGNFDIAASTATIVSATGDINVNTAVNTLTVTSAATGASAVQINEEDSAGKALSLLASSAGSGGSFALTSLSQPVTVNGVLTVPGGMVSLTEGGVTSNTTNGTTTVAGLTIAQNINVGSTGSISLVTTTAGNENIVDRVTLTAANISITANAGVGTSGSPFVTDALSSLTVNGTSSTSSIFIKDNNSGAASALNVASTLVTSGASVSITSKAQNLNVGQLAFSDVTLTDTVAGAITTINPGGATNTIGDGTGTVKVTTAGSLAQGGLGSGFIFGDSVVLSSSAGNIGNSGPTGVLDVSTPQLTASAVKGFVNIDGLQAMTLNTGTALSSYDVTMAPGATLNIGGIVKATTATTGSISLSADIITQSLATAYLSSANVSLGNLAASTGGTIGLGTGFQSIQTKAVDSLSVIDEGSDSTPFVAFVTQTGNITLGSGTSQASNMSGGSNSSLNLALAAGNKLTVDNNITFTNVDITAPASLTVGTGQISATNVTITSPVVILNNASGSINIMAPATGTASLSFVSTTSLSISGSGSVILPTATDTSSVSLSLAGQTGITIGSGSKGLDNPFLGVDSGEGIGGTGGSAGPLSGLSIVTAGVFTGNYSQFILAPVLNDSLSITATSLKNDGTPTSLGPFMLEANGSNSSSVNLALTGTQAVTLSSTSLSKAVTQPNFVIDVQGTVGSVSVTSGGILTVTSTGFGGFQTNNENTIALSGRELNLNGSTAGTGLPSNEFENGTFSSVSLSVTSGTFTLGALTSGSNTNGFVGSISAQYVTVAGPTLAINSETVTGAQMSFITSDFKLGDGSQIIGQGMGSITNSETSLSISNLTTGGLTIGVVSATDPGGTYGGSIASVLLESASGGINLGQLFTSANYLGGGPGVTNVTSIAISAAGTVTVPSSLSTLSVSSASPGSIFINATSLSYTPKEGIPQDFLTFEAIGGSVSLQLNSSIILGQARGEYDINVNNTGGTPSPGVGSYSVGSAGQLTVDETQNTASASLSGSTIALNNSITTSGTLQISALAPAAFAGSPVGIKEAAGVLISTGPSGQLIIGESNAVLPVAANVLNIVTPNLVVVSGALLLNNSFTGNVTVSQQNNIPTLNALALTNSSGPGGFTLTVNSLLTANGGIDIVNSNGFLTVAAGATLQTNLGSITLQNNDLTHGTITIGQNVTILGSGKATGVGQVSIVIGPVPTTTSTAGVQPGPDVPVTSVSGSAKIFYTTTANPFGSIVSEGLNVLDAAGRNIVFNANGTNSNITLSGGDSITADPPVAAAAPSAALVALSNPASNTIGFSVGANNFASAAGVPSGTVMGGQNVTVNASSQIPVVNWSLPTILAINANLQDGIAGPVTPVAGNGLLNGQTCSDGAVGCINNGLVLSGGGKPLSGSVSNCIVKSLERGVTLLAPKMQTTVNTGFGSVYVAGGSVVMVMAFDGGLAVYDLHDNKRGAVEVRVGDLSTKLSPGQNLVLTDRHIGCFEQINPVQSVAYRRMVSKAWGRGVQGFQSEFNILSMLQSVGALREMLQAKDIDTRRAVNSMLKTSAILGQFGGSQYEYMAAPTVTAMGAR